MVNNWSTVIGILFFLFGKTQLYQGLHKKIGRPFRDALFMGEEKPDEELMGKRKSSPRLSTTSCDADNYSFSVSGKFIHPVFEKKLM